MTAMTCDEVFDLLTGQLHAEGDQHRDALLRHLAGCRSCRRMADALEPAVELLRECAAAEDSSSAALLSGPWNDVEPSFAARTLGPSGSRLSPSRADWSVLSAAAPSSTPWMWQLFGGDLMRLAAAILVGLTLGALVWGQTDEPAKLPSAAVKSLLFTAHHARRPAADIGMRPRGASHCRCGVRPTAACCRRAVGQTRMRWYVARSAIARAS